MYYPSSGGGDGGNGGSGIAGIVIGSLVGVCGLGFCLRFLYNSHRSDTQHLTELTGGCSREIGVGYSRGKSTKLKNN